jgi:integrase/recombinase XerD
MFEQLFQRPYTVVRHRDGPLAEERLRYLRHLAEQGMCRRYLKVVASRLLIIIDYLRLANRPTADIDLTEIEQQASLWAKRLAKGEQRKYSWIAFCQHAKAWLRFLGRLRTPVPIPEPCAHLIDAFAAFMHSEQGLSAVTIDVRRKIIQGFLHRLRTTPQEFREITITQIDDALLTPAEGKIPFLAGHAYNKA